MREWTGPTGEVSLFSLPDRESECQLTLSVGSGLFWNAFMIDAENLHFIASWDTAQMNDIEVGECCDILADVMRKLANEENWHRSIASIFKSGKRKKS